MCCRSHLTHIRRIFQTPSVVDINHSRLKPPSNCSKILNKESCSMSGLCMKTGALDTSMLNTNLYWERTRFWKGQKIHQIPWLWKTGTPEGSVTWNMWTKITWRLRCEAATIWTTDQCANWNRPPLFSIPLSARVEIEAWPIDFEVWVCSSLFTSSWISAFSITEFQIWLNAGPGHHSWSKLNIPVWTKSWSIAQDL